MLDSIGSLLKEEGFAKKGDTFYLLSEGNYGLINFQKLKDEQVARKMDIEIHKGIFLNGPVGAGKTSLMHLLNYLPEGDAVHSIRSCRDISFEFPTDGYEVIAATQNKASVPKATIPKQ